MFNNVSWQGYWSLMALLIITYYFALFLIFKKWSQPKILHEPSLIKGDYAGPESPLPIRAPQASQGTANGNTMPQLSVLADELQAYFDAAPQGVEKLQLLDDVKNITKKYPGFPSEHYGSINNLIIFLAEQNCSLHIRSDEVVDVWST